MRAKKNNKIFIPKNCAIIFFDKDNYIICDAVGIYDRYFIGDLFLINEDSSLSEYVKKNNNMHFCFLKDLNFNYEDIDLIKNKCYLIEDQSKLLSLENIENSLLLYNFDKSKLFEFSQKISTKCLKYFSRNDTYLDVKELEVKLYSFLSRGESSIRNNDLIQDIFLFKAEKFSFFKKNIVILDFGNIPSKLTKKLTKDYNVYVLNAHINLRIIQDINPCMIILSDGYTNCEIGYYQFIDKIEFFISMQIPIIAFGINMYNIGKRFDIIESTESSELIYRNIVDLSRDRIITNSDLSKKIFKIKLNPAINLNKINYKITYKSLDDKYIFGFDIFSKERKEKLFSCFYSYDLFLTEDINI